MAHHRRRQRFRRTRWIERERDDQFSRVGSGSFADTSLVQSYKWYKQVPVTSLPARRGGLMSLRRICHTVISRNLHEISTVHLDSASWRHWKCVWSTILDDKRDSLNCFLMFSSRFADLPDFRAHARVAAARARREEAIQEIKVPNVRCHRLENLFRNIDFASVVTYLTRFDNKPKVLLDISTTHVERTQLFHMLHVPYLAGLNLSNQRHVDDSFLQSIGSAMASDLNLPNLVVLQVNNCPAITAHGITTLMKTVGASACSLLLVQCDIELEMERRSTYVFNTKWMALDTQASIPRVIRALPLGLKISTLYRYLTHQATGSFPTGSGPGFQDAPVLDFFVHDVDSSSNSLVVDEGWRARARQAVHDYPRSQLYVVNQKREIAKVQEHTEPAQKKIKRIKASASAFFSM